MTVEPEVFQQTLQETNRWLKEIEQELGTNRQRAYLALRGTLHALRDELVPDEAAQLSAQLPMLVRGIYFEGWDPSKTPVKERNREGFLKRVGKAFERTGGVNPERAARAVFNVLNREMDPGELEQVRRTLPASVRALWPSPRATLVSDVQVGSEAMS
jgi:uncharacterized protein (DUF2267 family)